MKYTIPQCTSKKQCLGPCGQMLPYAEFVISRGRYAGNKYDFCTSCRASRKGRTFAKYGITQREYIEMLIEQGHACAACKEPEKVLSTANNGSVKSLSIDHDHKTGKVRALLCQRCNQTLGMIHDDPERLRALADYIERFQEPDESDEIVQLRIIE